MKKQFKAISTALLMLLCYSGIQAQLAPIKDTLRVNSIQASVQSNGAFFQGGQSGQFLVPASSGSANSLSLMKSAGLWMGGLDSAGNLKLSAQLYNENGKTDFYPGILNLDGTPNYDFNLIAGVTLEEINTHLNNPGTIVPSIYSWPANGNPYFSNYYNFDLPFDNPFLAGYYDQSFDGQYSPFAGDYPSIELRGCPLNNKADEQLWFPYHDAGPHTQTGGEPINMEIQTQFFGFNCQEGSPVDRVVYVRYKLINRNTIPLNSFYLGVFMDFEIGNGGDDFIGCNPQKRIAYAYNGDDLDEGGFEQTPPIMAVDFLRGPSDPETGEEIKDWHFIPVETAGLDSPEEYYNLLKGRAADGTPFPNNGIVYPGNPLNPAQSSEISAGNTPGERKALSSFGPFTLVPGAINELVLGYFWVRDGINGGVSDNLSVMLANDAEVKTLYYNCFELFQGCPAGVSTHSPQTGVSLAVSPNPFTDKITVECPGSNLQSVFLYHSSGQLIRTLQSIEAPSITFQTGNLPSGVYWIKAITQEGKIGFAKLVHEK